MRPFPATACCTATAPPRQRFKQAIKTCSVCCSRRRACPFCLTERWICRAACGPRIESSRAMAERQKGSLIWDYLTLPAPSQKGPAAFPTPPYLMRAGKPLRFPGSFLYPQQRRFSLEFDVCPVLFFVLRHATTLLLNLQQKEGWKAHHKRRLPSYNKRNAGVKLNFAPAWCRRPGSNRHGYHYPRDFKSRASANFATPANFFLILSAGPTEVKRWPRCLDRPYTQKNGARFCPHTGR